MDGLLSVNTIQMSGATGSKREPLSTLSGRNTGNENYLRRKRSARKIAQGGGGHVRRGSDVGMAAAETQHIARVRASRSASSLGLESLYQPAKEKLLSSTPGLYGSASAAELGGFGFDGNASTKSRTRSKSARLAARRRGSTASGAGASKSSRVVNAVQGLDQASKQALLDVIKMERQNRTAQQQKEDLVDRMHGEASRNAKAVEEEQRIFDAIAMLESTELEQQAQAGSQILQFCATAVEPCPAMIMRACAVYGQLHQSYSGAGEERSAAVKTEREKWEGKVAAAERRHKEAMSKLGATMSSDMKAIKAKLEAVTAERDSAHTAVQELKGKHAADAKKLERLSAKLAAMQESAECAPAAAPGPVDSNESSQAAEEAAKEIALLKSAVTASDKEMKEMKTRLKKMLGRSKKDQATTVELTEALEHARAQLAALMEENERLKSASIAATDPQPAQEDLSEFAGKLKDLEIAATRGQAPTLNIDRGTAEADISMLPEGTVTTEIAIDEADQHGSPSAGDSVFGGLGMEDIEVGGNDESGMFGAGASPIASTEMTSLEGENSFFEEKDGTGLDTAIIVTEDGAHASTEANLRREVEQLRLRNAELEAALDKALDSGSESEDDVPLSCAKKPVTRTALPPLSRPDDVPALDFSNLEQKLKELDAAEAEAEAAEKASKGESTVLEEVIDPNYVPTDKDIAEYAAFLQLDLDNEPELAWIAQKGLVTPLPEGWKPCAAPSGELYYFNFDTGESVWEHPGDEYYRNLVQVERQKLRNGGHPGSA